MPHIDIAQLAAEYQAGASLRTLAQRYAYSHTQIADILEAAGVPRRAKAWRHPFRICPACGCSFRPKQPDQERCSGDCHRGTHAAMCRKGHPLIPENLTPCYGHTSQRCRQCMNATSARYRARKGESR
jgi:hypothetical protein